MLSPRSLRVRSLLVTLAVAVTPVLFVAASDYSDRNVGAAMLARVQHVADAVRDGDADVEGLARAQAVWVRVVRPDGVEEHDRASTRGLGDTLLFGDDGASTLREWDEDEGPLASRPLVAQAAVAPTSGCDKVDHGRLLVCTAALTTPDGVVVVMDGSRRAIRSFYDPRYQLGRLVLFSVLLGVSVGAGLGWWLVRPVATLRRAVLDRVASGSARPIPVDRDDEIADLAKAYNQLLATLEARRRDNEAFAADLVHELKNPIAAVRTTVDILPGAADPERRARIEHILRDSTGRMEVLVRQFLELARAEAGLPHDEREPVDLLALVRSIADTMEGCTVEVTGAGTAPAAPERLEAALRNVLANAASFSPHVRVTIDGGVVRVDDDGPGFDPADLPKVFDRYFTRRREGGTGLGLPLARAIVEAHGGRITASNRLEGGARVELVLPTEPTA